MILIVGLANKLYLYCRSRHEMYVVNDCTCIAQNSSGSQVYVTSIWLYFVPGFRGLGHEKST